jgi:hypothetical protein
LPMSTPGTACPPKRTMNSSVATVSFLRNRLPKASAHRNRNWVGLSRTLVHMATMRTPSSTPRNQTAVRAHLPQVPSNRHQCAVDCRRWHIRAQRLCARWGGQGRKEQTPIGFGEAECAHDVSAPIADSAGSRR